MVVKKIKKKVVKKVVKKKKPAKRKPVKSKAQSKPIETKKTSGKPYKYAEYLIFIDWVATPRVDREPEHQEDFAEEFKISEATLSEWKKKVDFWEEVKHIRRMRATERTGDVIRKLELVAIGGDVQAIRTYLQYTGELIEKKENSLGASPELIEALDRMRKFLPD